ncbi:hypothetical protein [Streptomyces inhibens]|uniref:hypothetical protein n=1 Tax=Streptomyces inhibens TaxID=2293571 RepID=UPI001EE6A91A|nr:hypothetical protein [Streptomyces inhibens]UKY48566.1 hypothetical protein KI385_06985 [Streptomyces inhibens]
MSGLSGVVVPAPGTRPARSTVSRWLITVMRALACLFLLDTLAQAALAGLFVTGDVDLLRWHDANAQVLSALAALQIAAAMLIRLRTRGPRWPVAVTALLLALVAGQQALGHARILAGHIPLGMAVFGIAAALTCWAFTFRPLTDSAQELQ